MLFRSKSIEKRNVNVVDKRRMTVKLPSVLLFVDGYSVVVVIVIIEDIMEDRHAQQISAALKSIASAIGGLAFAIFMGSMYVYCGLMSHH